MRHNLDVSIQESIKLVINIMKYYSKILVHIFKRGCFKSERSLVLLYKKHFGVEESENCRGRKSKKVINFSTDPITWWKKIPWQLKKHKSTLILVQISPQTSILRLTFLRVFFFVRSSWILWTRFFSTVEEFGHQYCDVVEFL